MNHTTIPEQYRNTPSFYSEFLGRRIDGVVMIKDETATPIRSFKGRGAFHLCASLPTPGLHLVCASAGNFGQGLAVAGVTYGCRVTVFVSVNVYSTKLARMRELGADVKLVGLDFDEAKDCARAYSEEVGGVFIEDGADDRIADGASTLGYEMLDEGGDFDVVALPLGNGALVVGVARAFKAQGSTARIVAVSALGAPAMAQSWRSDTIVTAAAHTIADGIAVRKPVPTIMPELRARVDEVLEVSEESIEEAIRLVYRCHGIIAEPAGVVGIAALIEHTDRFRGARVATAICGGNISTELHSKLFR